MAKKRKISKTERRKIAIAQERIKAREQMEQMMLNKEIYIISIDEKGTPFLADNQYLLLYFKKEAADDAVQGFRNLYGDGKIYTFKIEDNMSFFEMMWNYGMPEFILNGSSNIYNIGVILERPKKPKYESKGIEVGNQQPIRDGGVSLSKKIIIKEWFSFFSNISLVCGLVCGFMTFVLITTEKMKENFIYPLMLLLYIAGIISGIIAVHGAHSRSVESEESALCGLVCSVISLLIGTGSLYM